MVFQEFHQNAICVYNRSASNYVRSHMSRKMGRSPQPVLKSSRHPAPAFSFINISSFNFNKFLSVSFFQFFVRIISQCVQQSNGFFDGTFVASDKTSPTSSCTPSAVKRPPSLKHFHQAEFIKALSVSYVVYSVSFAD